MDDRDLRPRHNRPRNPKMAKVESAVMLALAILYGAFHYSMQARMAWHLLTGN